MIKHIFTAFNAIVNLLSEVLLVKQWFKVYLKTHEQWPVVFYKMENKNMYIIK